MRVDQRTVLEKVPFGFESRLGYPYRDVGANVA